MRGEDSDAGGHAWVVDGGYRYTTHATEWTKPTNQIRWTLLNDYGEKTSEYLHINWGWNGICNGLFILGNLASGKGNKYDNAGSNSNSDNFATNSLYLPLFISPLSASFALSMVSNGAVGNTWQELTDVLGFSSCTQEDMNGYHGKLMQELAALDKESELGLANSLWVDQGFSVYDTFKQLLAGSYGAEIRQQDLAASLDDINAWCSEKTNGRIPKVLEQEPEGIKLLLLNALYFKSKWTTPFDKNDTWEDTFANEDGTSSRTAFMHQESPALYGWNELFALAALPTVTELSACKCCCHTKG